MAFTSFPLTFIPIERALVELKTIILRSQCIYTITMSILFRILLAFAIYIVIDIYAFQAVRTATRDASWAKWLYWFISIAYIILLIYSFSNFSREAAGQSIWIKITMGLFVLLIVPKIVVSMMMLTEDLTRILVGLGGRVSGSSSETFLPSRRKFVSQLALGLAAIPLAGIIHGIWRGRYNFRVIKKTLFFEDLPSTFDGLTISQISDVHSGSFDNAEKIKYAIDLINEQQSDLIVFTGDLVNNKASEMEPWKEIFAKLKAPLGKYSILGNHDYGDYVQWASNEEKQANMQQLFETHKDMGFDLMRNESRSIERNGEKIQLLGVENWGTGGFHQYGDLDKALEKVALDDFSILLSHDPSHFDHVVKTHSKKVHLTLSGHTHGMQFGIEIPGLVSWSPVKYRYPKWAGLYKDLGQYLYVNRGFGFLAFPGRVGIWPEITVLELKKGTETT